MAISTTDANSKPDDKERLPELDDDVYGDADETQDSQDAPATKREDRVAKSETTEDDAPESPRDAMVRRYRELRDGKVAANDDEDDKDEVERPAAAAAASPEPVSTPAKVEPPAPSPNDVALEATRALLEQTRTMVEEARALRSPAPSRAPAANDDDGENDANETAPQRSAAEDDERLEEIVERIQIGDKAEGRAALAELIEIVGSKVHAGMKPDEIGKAVQSHLAQERVTEELKGAATAFRDKYKGLVEDQDLLDTSFRRLDSELRNDLVKIGVPEAEVKGADSNTLMNMHRSARLTGKPVRAYGEIFETVGSTVQSKFASVLGPSATEQRRTQPTQPLQPVNSERVERKRQMSAQPRAVGMRSDPQPQQRPKTREEVVADMRRQRGFKA